MPRAPAAVQAAGRFHLMQSLAETLEVVFTGHAKDLRATGQGRRVCDEHGIEHWLAKVSRPWTNGQVGCTSRSLKDATVKRCRYASRDALRTRVQPYLGCLQLRPPPQGAARPHALQVYVPNLDPRPWMLQARHATPWD